MVERKAFLANPKHQYHVSQYGEHYCSAHIEKNGDYNEYQSLSHFIMNFNDKKNGGKKTFSCKSKASISCNTIGRTLL